MSTDRASRSEFLPPPAEDLVTYLDGVALELLRQSPETITTRGVAARLGVRNDSLDSLVLDASGESFAPIERALERIGAADLSGETPERRRQIETFAQWLRSALDGRPYQERACLVSTYLTSYPQHLAWFLTEIHPLRTAADVEDYVSRLAQIPARFGELVTRLEKSEKERTLAPRFLLVRAADEIDALGRGPVEESVFFARLASAVGSMTDRAPGERDSLLAGAVEVAGEVVLPAYAQLAASVREFAARATDDIGIWRAEEGDLYYAHLLRAYTTTDLTADEIYALGLREVARLQGEVRSAAAALGFAPHLSLPDLFAKVRRRCGVVSGSAAVFACRELVDRMARLVRPAFLSWPDALPRVEAGGSTAYFVDGSDDGARPGTFYVPVDQERATCSLRPLVCHEAVPGHALQMAMARRADTPAFLDGVSFSAFTEGWATYAERLAWELGAYDADEYGNLCRLQEELFRAARLVVDPGIHAKRWTYDEAVAYMIETVGLDEATARREVERYAVTPGQAIAYGVGLLKFLELREQARAALGPAFDLAQFHEVVLSSGSVPLSVLEDCVDDFVHSQLGAQARTP